MKAPCAAVLLAVSPTTLPSAAADPQQFPDLGGYTEVNLKDYLTYSAYSTLGAQFVSPGGYRCRLSYISKAAASMTLCWGSLPGTSHNLVGVSYPSCGAATFADKDWSAMEQYQWIHGPGNWHDGTVSPDADKPHRTLRAHGKMTYNGEMCGVDESMAACVLAGHGFVLSPNGSWTF